MNLEELQIKVSIELKDLEKQLKSITKSIDKTLGPQTTKRLMQSTHRVIKNESLAINKTLNKAFEVDYKSFNNNLNAAMNQAKLTVRSACNDIRRELNSALNVKANIRVTGKTSIDGSATGSSGSTTASSMASSQYIGAMIIKATNAIIKNDNSNTSRLENTINKSTKEIVSAIKNIKIDSKPTHINSGNNKDVVKAINTSTRDIVSAINNINTQDKKTNQKSTTTKKSTSTERNEPKLLTNSRQGQKALTTSGINFDLGEAGKQISAITKKMIDAVKVINIFKRNFSSLLNDFNTKQLGTGSYGNKITKTSRPLGEAKKIFTGEVIDPETVPTGAFEQLQNIIEVINYEIKDTEIILADVESKVLSIVKILKGLKPSTKGAETLTGEVVDDNRLNPISLPNPKSEPIVIDDFIVIDDELEEQINEAVSKIKQVSLPTDVFDFDADEAQKQLDEVNEKLDEVSENIAEVMEAMKLINFPEFELAYGSIDNLINAVTESIKTLTSESEKLENLKITIDTSDAEKKLENLLDTSKIVKEFLETGEYEKEPTSSSTSKGKYPPKAPGQNKSKDTKEPKGKPPKPTIMGFGFGAYKNEIDMLIEYAKKAGSKIKQALFGKKDGGSSIPDELAMTIDDGFNDEINAILDNIYNCLKSISADIEAIKSIISKNYVAQKEPGDSTQSKSSTFEQFKKANNKEDSLEKRLLEDDDLFEEYLFDALKEKIKDKMDFVLGQDDSKTFNIYDKLKDMNIDEETPVNIDGLVELGNYIEELKREVMSDKLNKAFDIDVKDAIEGAVLSEDAAKKIDEVADKYDNTRKEIEEQLKATVKGLREHLIELAKNESMSRSKKSKSNSSDELAISRDDDDGIKKSPKTTTLGFGFGAYKNELELLGELAKKAGAKIKKALSGAFTGIKGFGKNFFGNFDSHVAVHQVGELKEKLSELTAPLKKAGNVLKSFANGISKGLNGAKKVLSGFANASKSLWGKIKSIFSKGANDTVKVTDKLKTGLGDLLKQALGFLSLYSLINLGKEAIQQSTMLAQSEVKLASLMKQRMGATNETITAIRQLAEEQAKLGVVSETAMKHGAQQLARYVHSAKALKELMPAIANLTAARGGVFATEDDAEEIATQLGEAIREGTTTPLEQSGIYLSEAEIEKFKALTTEEARAAYLADVIAKNVGNINEALANTPHGAIAQLKNNFKSLLGTLGIFLANVIKPIVQWLNVIVVACNNALKALGKLLGFDMTGGATTVPDIGTGGGGGGSTPVDTTTPDIDTGGIDDAKDAYDDAKDAADEATEANEKFKGSLMGFDELNILTDNTQKDYKSDPEKDPEKDPTDITPGEGGQLLPEVGELVEGESPFDKFADKMKAFIDEVLEPFKNAWDELGNRWKQAWADLVDSFKNFCDSLARFLKSVWDNGGKEFVQHLAEIALACGIAAMEIGGTILDALAKLWDHLDPEKNMHTQRLLDVLNEVSVKLRDFILGLNEHLENLLAYGGQDVLNAMGDCFMDLAAAAVNTFGVIIDAVDGLIDHLDPKFNVDTRNMLQATADMFHAVGQAAWDFSELLKSALANGGQDMINAFGTCVVNLAQTVVEVITTMMESFSAFFDYIDPAKNEITKNMMKAWEDAFYAIGDAALQFAELFDSIMDNGGQELLNAIGDLGMQILETFGNIVEEVADCVGQLFEHLDPAKNKVAKGAIDAFKYFVDSIRNFVEMLGDALGTFMDNGGQEFINNVGDIVALLLDLGATIGGDIINAISAFFDSWAGHIVISTCATALELISEVLEGLLRILEPLTPVISAVVAAIGAFMVAQKVVGFIEGIVGAFKLLTGSGGILALAKSGFTILWGVISANPIAAVIAAITAVGVALVALYNNCEGFREFADKVLEGFKGAFDKIKEYCSKLLEDIREIFGNVIDIITGIFEGDGEKVGEAVRNLIFNILELIYDLNQSFVEIGWELIKGLVKGIWECIKALPSLLAGFCEFVVDFFKGLFGIHSPSTVFAELGVNLIEGLIEGIESMFEAIGETITLLVDSILEAFNGIGEKLSEIWENIKNSASELWNNIKDAIVDKCKETYDNVKEKYENIRDTVSDKLGEVKEKASDAWTKIKEKTSDLVSKMKDDAEDKYSKLKDKLTTTMEDWRKNSEDKWNKIKEKTASLVDTLKKDAEDKYNKLKDKLTETMENWKKNSEEKWNNIKDKTSDLVSKLKDETEDKYNKFKDKLTETMENWRKNSEEKWTKIKEKTTELAENLKSTVEDKYNKFKDNLTTTLENLRSTSQEKWTNIKDKTTELAENLKSTVEDKFNTLKTNLASKMSDIKSDMETKWNNIKERATSLVENLRSTVEEKFNTLKTNLASKMSEIKSNIETKWGEIKTNAINKASEVVTNVTTKYNELKTNVTNKMAEVKSNAKTKWDEIKTDAKSGAEGMVKKAGEGLSGLSKTLTDAINKAKTAASDAWDKVKNIFSGKINMPKLPKLKVEWETFSSSWFPDIKIPKLSWNARGGIIDGITPLGFANGALQMGGEAGKEMIVPLENTSFTSKIAQAMGQAVDNALARQSNPYNNSYNTTNDNRDIVLQINDREFARASINSINKLQRESGKTLLNI